MADMIDAQESRAIIQKDAEGRLRRLQRETPSTATNHSTVAALQTTPEGRQVRGVCSPKAAGGMYVPCTYSATRDRLGVLRWKICGKARRDGWIHRFNLNALQAAIGPEVEFYGGSMGPPINIGGRLCA